MATEKPELSAHEVKEMLKEGQEVSGAYIPRLNLSKMQLDFPIQIVDCEIGTLDLNRADVPDKVTVRRCKIDMCVLSEATFHDKVDFKKCSIGRGRFQRVTFEQTVNFSEASLAYSSFHQSEFKDKTDFSRCTFVGDATFTEVNFASNVKFIHSKYKERGIYHKCQFHGKADFKNIEVAKDMELKGSTAHSELLLNSSVIQLSLNLIGAHLEGKTDFASVSVGRNLSLTGVTVGEDQSFRFINSSAGTIVFEREIVEGHVWPEQEGDYAAAAREYGFLRTAFEHINRFDDEDWAYYQFKRNERRGMPMSYNPIDLLMRAGNYLFLDIGCGYGTKPLRTLAVIAIIVAFFGGFYLLGVPVPPGVDYGVSWPAFNKVMHSLYCSMLAFSGSVADAQLKGGFRLLGMIEYALGVVFMGLFIVAFSRKVIR
ncbi:MAG: pentapeptide repeat-containing protein [Deltaproteobacteria bacterium]|nr:MAG: pentapeptide repeat-containing protein [Deltaproteobacteria bacterium]